MPPEAPQTTESVSLAVLEAVSRGLPAFMMEYEDSFRRTIKGLSRG